MVAADTDHLGVPPARASYRHNGHMHLLGLATRVPAEMSEGAVTVCPSIHGMHGRRHEG